MPTVWQNRVRRQFNEGTPDAEKRLRAQEQQDQLEALHQQLKAGKSFEEAVAATTGQARQEADARKRTGPPESPRASETPPALPNARASAEPQAATEIEVTIPLSDGSEQTVSLERGPNDTDADIQKSIEELSFELEEQVAAREFGGRILRNPSPRATYPAEAMVDDEDLAAHLKFYDAAADAGIDVTTGLDSRIRAQMSLVDLDDPQAAQLVLESHVDKMMKEAGVKVPDSLPLVYKDPYTDELAYLRPVQQEDGSVAIRPTLVEEGGLPTVGDFADLAGGVLSVVPEVVGAIGAGLAGAAATGGSPAGAAAGGAAGAGAGAAVGALARRELARAWGVPDEIADRITGQDAFVEALYAAGFETLVPVAGAAVRTLRNRGRFLKDDGTLNVAEIKQHAANVKESVRVLQDEYGVRMDITIAEQTGRPEAAVALADVRRRSVGKRSQEMRETEVANQLATGEAVRKINSRAVDEYTPSRAAGRPGPVAGEDAQDVIRQPSEIIDRNIRQGERDLESLARTVDGHRNAEPFLHLQDDIAGAKDAAIARENEAWEYFRTSLEPDENGIPNIVIRNPQDSPINQFLGGLDERSQRALLQTISRDQEALLTSAGFTEGGGLTQQVLDPEQMHYTLSWLNRRIRLAETQSDPDNLAKNELEGLRAAIRQQISQDGIFARRTSNRQVNPAKADAIRYSFDEANAATRTRVDLFENDAISKILDTKRVNDQDRFVTEPENIEALLFTPNDPRPLAHVLDVVGANPSVRAALGDQVVANYRRSVFDHNNVWMPGAHRQWMDAYSGQLRLLDIDPDFIRHANDLGTQVDRLRRKSKAVDDALRDVYGRTLTTQEKYGGDLVSDMLSDRLTLDQVRSIRNRIQRVDPSLWADILQNGSEHTVNALTKNVGKVANANNIDNLLNTQRDRLRIIYGDRYVNDMTHLRDVMAAIEGVSIAGGTKRELTPPLLQMTRALMGPLSKKQRFITATQKQRQRMLDKLMHDIISDPQKIERYIELNRMSANSTIRWQGLVALGIPEDVVAEGTDFNAPTLPGAFHSGSPSDQRQGR